MRILYKKNQGFRFDEKETRKNIIIIYIVGLIGFILPFTYPLFVKLIPYTLLLSFLLLFYFNRTKYNLKSVIVYFSIFLLGLIIEIIGVETNIIFGNYRYGSGLGFKIFDTPLIIGINWLFLVYASSAVLEKTNFHVIIKILLAAFVMLIYDIVMEQVAPIMDMWHWKGGNIPMQNYFAWFILGVFFNSLIKIFKIRTENNLAFTIIMCQFLFFCILFLFFKFVF